MQEAEPMIYDDAPGQHVAYSRVEDDVWLVLEMCAVVSVILALSLAVA
jgi:hypothetical protein